MPACSAIGCTNRPGKKIGISFHRFPKHPTLRDAWVEACKRTGWSPSKVSVLCSEHFPEDQIDRTSFKTVQLKRKAIPSIFRSIQKSRKTANMPACSAIGCTNRPDRYKPGLTFHRFPRENVLRAAWIVACRRKDWLPSPCSVLCNEHFSEDLIDRTSISRVRLRRNAIPTIFKGIPKKSDCQQISVKDESPPKQNLSCSPLTVFLNDEETQSCDEGESQATELCCEMETLVGLNSTENESSTEYVLPVPVPEKRSAFKKAVAFVNEVIKSSYESSWETSTKHNAMKPTVCFNSSVNESTVENRLPVEVPEKHSAFKKAVALASEVMKSSHESLLETSTKQDAMKPTVCFNSSVNESTVENRLPVQIPEISMSPKEILPPTTTTTIFNNEIIQSSGKNITKCPRKWVLVQTTDCLNSSVNESSVENMDPMQIPKKRKTLEKCVLSTPATAFSDNEEIASSDESLSETSSECGAKEPIDRLNSSVNEYNVEIKEEESDSELYPTEDIETLNLRRKLTKANNLITSYRKKIKILQQQNRRCKEHLEKAKRTISVLEKTNKSVIL